MGRIISMATIRGLSVRESINVAVQSGCGGIEIQTDYLPEAAAETEAVFAYARQRGLYVSLHGPSSDINISSLNRGIRRESVRQLQEAIDLAARFGVEKLTVHPGLLSSMREDPEEKWRVMLDSVGEIGEYAALRQVHVGMENMEKRKKELVYTVDDLNRFGPVAQGNPWLGVTLDFCHFATNGILLPVLSGLEIPIKNVHISQCVDGKPHFPLDVSGQLDLPAIIQALDAAGYGGSVTMEIKSVFDYRVYRRSREVLESAAW